MAKRWLILGAGVHGRSVADAIGPNGDHVVGFFDDGHPVGTLLNGMPVLGALSLAWELDRFFTGSDEGLPIQWLWTSAIQRSGKPGSRCLSRCPHTSAR
jgi:hypothetical protein